MKFTIVRISFAILGIWITSQGFGAPNPLLFLKFENSVADQAAPAHQVGIDGAVTFEQDAPDQAGGPTSARFSGTAPSGVIVTNSSDLGVSGGAAFSIAAWIRTDFTNGDRVIVSKSPPSATVIPGESGTHTAAFFVDEDGKLRFDLYWVDAIVSSATVRNSQWTHVAVTYNGTDYSLYVNGFLDGTATFDSANEAANGEPAWRFTVGEGYNTDFPGGVFAGNIDDVQFWNAALTEQDILSLRAQRVPIGITQQPADATTLAGTTATFQVQAVITGEPQASLVYQWQTNGVSIAGATNLAYTTSVLTTDDNGLQIGVVVTSGSTSVRSRQATLTVLPLQPVSGPLAYWSFENTLADQSTSSIRHDGAFEGPARFDANVPNATAGTNSVLFGGDSQVTITNAPDLNMDSGHPFSITAWIKTASPNGLIAAKSPPQDFISGGAGPHTPALFVDEDGNLRYDVFFVNELHSSHSVTNGQWNHVAVVYDGTSYTLYLNGVSEGSAGFSGANEAVHTEVPGWSFTIGQSLNSTFPPAHFEGNIDEVAFWNLTLTPAQIIGVMSQGVPKNAPIISITSHPTNVFVILGSSASNATFAVQASVSGAATNSLHFQWQKNGVDIPGATNATYMTPALTPADVGRSSIQAVVSSGSFSATSVPALFAVVQLESVPSPLAWWTFENTLLDQAGATNHHDGMLVGGARFDTNSPNATAGTASLLLDGQDSGVTVTNATDLNVNDGSPFSITAWIKTDFDDLERVIVAKAPPDNVSAGETGTHTAAFFVDEGGLLRYDNFYINAVISDRPVRNSRWTHVAVTYDAKTFTLYVDGLLNAQNAFAGSNEGANAEPPWQLTIGQSFNTTFPGGVFKGNIDEVAFWNEALSDGQIANIALNGVRGSTNQPPQQPHLSYQRAGNQVTFSWTETGFVLQQNANLSNPNGWADLPGGNNGSATVTIPASGNQFFRLRSL